VCINTYFVPTESSTVRDSNLNEPTQENLTSNQEHLRNPVYEAEIERIEAKVDKYIGMIEEVNGNQKEIMKTLALLCSRPQ